MFSLVIAREGGRSSIPETPVMESISRGVLDAPPSRGMTNGCAATGVAGWAKARLRRAHHLSSGTDGGHAALCPPYIPAMTAKPSQLPRIRKRKRRHPPRVLVQNQRPRDRRLGALAAVFAFAKPAVDADRRAFGLLQIHPRGINQFRRMADFAAQTDRKARLRLRVRGHGAAHHLRDRKVARAVGQFDHLL